MSAMADFDRHNLFRYQNYTRNVFFYHAPHYYALYYFSVWRVMIV